MRRQPLTGFLQAILPVVIGFFGLESYVAAQESRPHILLIMADDMGYECVRANGGSDYDTPHLDALAASGVRLTRCHAQPLCTPSRVQLMTGQYNSKNYVRFGQLDPDARTFAHHFRENGYDTVIAGKWQLDGGPQAPLHFGFNHWCLWQITARPSRHWGPGLEVDGRTVTYSEDQFGPDVVVEYLMEFFQRATLPQAKPFLAYYPMILPHDPFVSTPLNVEETKSKGKSSPQLFPDFIHYTDALVGRLVNRLDELGLRENTLILFVGDNGTSRKITSRLDGQDYRGGKGLLTRNGTHVPGIVSWPSRVEKGRTSDALVDLTDIFPTLAEAAGISWPKSLPCDGMSFLPTLLDQEGPQRQWSYCFYERGGNRQTARQFVHNHRFKLYDDGRFFDLERDLWETEPMGAPSGPVYEMLREALRKQMDDAKLATPRVRMRQRTVAPPTYQRKPRFDASTD